MSDEVLQRQLSLIEKETSDIETMLAVMEVNDLSPDEAIIFAEGYLLQPNSVWKRASLHTQQKLQWFQFPQGITLDGEKFGTKEISIVFQAKEAILSTSSARVDIIGFEPVTSARARRKNRWTGGESDP
ncbi:MAG: hypothetical protein ACREGH_00250 [Minisyncoccia bacterium]